VLFFSLSLSDTLLSSTRNEQPSLARPGGRVCSNSLGTHVCIKQEGEKHSECAPGEEDIEIGDYRIPEGWPVIVALSLAHQLPALFAEPQRIPRFSMAWEYAPGKTLIRYARKKRADSLQPEKAPLTQATCM
jgi:hypothetical protein